jgi:hypothetical protein
MASGKQVIRIGGGQGFWGDLQTAPVDLVRKGPIDYLTMDFLAELTMSIMRKQLLRDRRRGFAGDLVVLMEQLLPDIVGKNIRVITNGGGANPSGCREALVAVARSAGIRGLRIGAVLGDDILSRVGSLMESGIPLANMESGAGLALVRDRLASANVYLGAGPIVEALRRDAHIVVTGRTADASLALAAMMFEFGWKADDWNRLAAGIVVGHILECGAQATGGNFSGDWKSVPDLAHVGFPIAEVRPDGTAVITKHPGTGGRVSAATVKEQLVYEIGDPAAYITPDCVADFTSVRLREVASDRVEVAGVIGKPATADYKVSMSYLDGYSAHGTLTYAWPEALEKAKKADEILRTRLSDLGLRFEEIRTEYLGYDSCFGPLAGKPGDLNEVVLRIGVRGGDKAAVERFCREIAPLVLTGPPSVTGYAASRPKPSEVIAYWPALIPKRAVTAEVSIEET